jgi:uncharacterized protein (TIGR01777 family)
VSQSKNFLLTGGTGFIGERLIAALLGRGRYVSLLTRRVRPREDRNVGQFFWNFESPAPPEPLEWADTVIHLAGEPVAQRWTREVKRRIRDSRVLGTQNLVAGIAKLPAKDRPEGLIAASAIGYYGDCGDDAKSETSAPGTGFLADICVEWEREAAGAADLGLRVAKVRIGIVLGPDGGALQKMVPPFRLGVGGALGTGRQWMSWIHIDDLVNLFVHAGGNPGVTGPLNGSAPNPVRNAEFTATLARTLGRPAFLPVPEFALRLLFGEMAEVMLCSERALPDATQRSGFQFTHPNLGPALANLVK